MPILGRIVNILIICAFGCMASVSCGLEEHAPLSAENKTVSISGRWIPEEALVPGMVRMKISEEWSGSMDIRTASDGRLLSTGVRSMDDALSSLGIVMMKRTFPYAGEFEDRTRAEGLHLWYDVFFDPEQGLTRAGESLAVLEGVTQVEFRPVITFSSDYQVRYAAPESDGGQRPASTEVFDDPGLAKQWHYYNDGSVSDTALSGADINVLPVWKKGITGNPDVIVCVVDKGVDYSHEDLKDNMWTGEDEQGNPIHGYNFMTDSYEIVPGDHGTHIAGTISAVNNNGVGVSGIAGGDKAAGVAGVKIMSCQIASDDDFAYVGGAAIKWAADHGAVISQNSWQYGRAGTELMDSDKEGIDYFIKYAGLDADGRQTGPMAGGVVFFAAGNASSGKWNPMMYEKVIAISGIRSDFSPAAYNNFGPWVDLAAPGGEISFLDKTDRYYTEQYTGDGIFSTLPPNVEGVAYGFMAGTSMACPHAAGVAALIVSHLGGQGFTADELKLRMFSTASPIDDYTEIRKGEYGKGLIDAEKAILGTSAEAPAAVADFKAESNANRVDISFTLPAKGAQVRYAYLFISDADITEENYMDAAFHIYDLRELHAGDVFTGQYTADFETEYYMAVVLENENNAMSEVSNCVKVTTGENHAPQIVAVDGDDLTLTIYERLTYRFAVSDEDGHEVEVYDEGMPGVAFYEFESDTLYLTINARASKTGSYSFKLIAEDEYGMSSQKTVSYTVVEECDTPPAEEPDEPSPDIPADSVSGDGELQVELYPNPVRDLLYLESLEGELDSEVILYSSTGVVVLHVEKKIGGGVPMNLSDLPGGVYTMKVICGERVAVKNLVKL